MSKRILFVDDEENILQGLRRLLRPLRKEWDMRFASDGHEALKMLEETTCDVLVSDMRMPGMNGVRLLEEVRARHPDTIRIVLSGQADRDTTLAAVGPAHQYLNKPCDAETLRGTIERALKLRERISSEVITRLVARTDKLPSVPQVYLDLKHELESDVGSIANVAEIIARDPAMTAKVLQVVNSAFFGVRREVVNPLEAVRQLGFDLISSLALSAGIFGQVVDKRFEALAEQLWRHSFTTAAFAKAIAQAENAEAKVVDTAMTAALVHDLGKLILASCLGDEYLALLRDARKSSEPMWQLEQEAFGTTHAEVGAYLLALWALPDRIVEVVAYHHCPSEMTDQSRFPLTMVHVANGFAHECAGDSTGIDEDYLEACGLDGRFAEWQQVCREAVGGEARP